MGHLEDLLHAGAFAYEFAKAETLLECHLELPVLFHQALSLEIGLLELFYALGDEAAYYGE